MGSGSVTGDSVSAARGAPPNGASGARAGPPSPATPGGRDTTSAMAFVAFLAGLSAVAFPLAIVLGLFARSRIARDGSAARSRFMANLAVGLGLLWLLLSVFAVAILMSHTSAPA